jgi:hypothetical protein
MWKYITEKETEVWADVLHKFVFGYDHSFHSSIGMMPSEAIKEENAGTVWYNLYDLQLEKTFGMPKFKIGQFNSTLKKGYMCLLRFRSPGENQNTNYRQFREY